MGDNLSALCSEVTEESALGCMFLDEAVGTEGCRVLKAEDFYNPTYRAIFEAAQGTEVVNVSTVWAELQRIGEAERVGFGVIAEIATSVGTSVDFRHHARILKRLSWHRRTVRAGQDLIQAALRQKEADVARILDAMRQDGYTEHRLVTAAEAFEGHIRNLAEIRRQGKRLMGLSTGLKDLDDVLCGLRKGNLIVIAGRPGMGKSSLALDIARSAKKELREDGKQVVIFSLEMGSGEMGARLFQAEMLFSNDKEANFRDDTVWSEYMQMIEEGGEAFTQATEGMYIDDRPGLTLSDIQSVCHSQQIGGGKIGLVIVDYLQLMAVGSELRAQEIGDISRGLKLLAKELDCPVIALSQVSRKCEESGDKRPMLSHLRDSGAIEQDADVVILMYREEYYFPECAPHKRGTGEAIIAKHRHGPTDTVRLRWIGECTTFRNLEKFQKTNEKPPKEWE